jgi:hypothetical protein
MIINGFCDFNWGGDLDIWQTTTGFTFLLANVTISWSRKKQPIVALSTIEAEYMVVSQSQVKPFGLGDF